MAESKKGTVVEKETAVENDMVDLYKVKRDTTIVVNINGKPNECFFSRGSVIKVKSGANMDENTFEKMGTEKAPEKKKEKFFDPTM